MKMGPLVTRQRIRHLTFVLLVLALCIRCSQFAAAESRGVAPKIGELWSGTESQIEPYRQAYMQGMRALGWIDGKTAQFVARYDGGNSERFPALAAELLKLGVDVLVVTNKALPATRQATTKVPIVCVDMFDPVAQGVAASLARPGGNVTGVSWQSTETAAKRLELAQDLIPRLRRVSFLLDAGDPGAEIEAK